MSVLREREEWVVAQEPGGRRRLGSLTRAMPSLESLVAFARSILKTRAWPLALPVASLAWFAYLRNAHQGHPATSGSLQSLAAGLTMLLLLLTLPLAASLFAKVNRRTVVAVALMLAAGAAAGMGYLASSSFEKKVAIPPGLPGDEAACSGIENGDVLLRRAPANEIWLRDRSCASDARGDLYVVVRFEWRMKEFALGVNPERLYGGRYLLVASLRRTTDGRDAYDALELRDYSVQPIKGWWAYLLGWVDVPFVASEATLVTDPLDKLLRQSAPAIDATHG